MEKIQQVIDKSTPKRKQETYPIFTKIMAIKGLELGYKRAQVTKILGIPESTLRGWIKEEKRAPINEFYKKLESADLDFYAYSAYRKAMHKELPSQNVDDREKYSAALTLMALSKQPSTGVLSLHEILWKELMEYDKMKQELLKKASETK